MIIVFNSASSRPRKYKDFGRESYVIILNNHSKISCGYLRGGRSVLRYIPATWRSINYTLNSVKVV